VSGCGLRQDSPSEDGEEASCKDSNSCFPVSQLGTYREKLGSKKFLHGAEFPPEGGNETECREETPKVKGVESCTGTEFPPEGGNEALCGTGNRPALLGSGKGRVRV